jgi:glycosyltransferase involved in cell wall biosynthesis
MFVSGFTFIRNAVRYDYPILEAIRSILPLCDEVVVAVGRSEDGTRELIEGLGDPRIRIIDTEWDDSLREGGRVLAVETNKALAAVAPQSDWCVYIQGDEVLHEDGLPAVRESMRTADDQVDGLLFAYTHFYGSYDYVGASAGWYRHEIRAIRPGRGIFSYRDAQGFRKAPDRPLNVVRVGATVHHYGWVKEPAAMQRKQESFHRMWHDDAWVAQHVVPAEAFDDGRELRHLARFTGTHPAVMAERIARRNWTFETDISVDRRTLKDRVKLFCAERLGWELGYTNYRLIR